MSTVRRSRLDSIPTLFMELGDASDLRMLGSPGGGPAWFWQIAEATGDSRRGEGKVCGDDSCDNVKMTRVFADLFTRWRVPSSNRVALNGDD